MIQTPLPTPTSAPKAENHGLLGKLRNIFLTGILVTAPAVLTGYFLYSLVTWLDGLLSGLLPDEFSSQAMLGTHVYGSGLVAGLVVVMLAGLLTRNFIGRWLVRVWEDVLDRIPVVRSVYSAFKQVLETVTVNNTEAFREVVLFEFPRKGIWAIGFVTGTTKGQVQTLTDDEVVNVFFPTTPNPTSGFLLFVPRKDLVKLDMTIEQGLKLVISGGIITPQAAGSAAKKGAKRRG
ncbi:MAG: DUF502 domain-containing protein [Alphaproteobacteria bacterium]